MATMMTAGMNGFILPPPLTSKHSSPLNSIPASVQQPTPELIERDLGGVTADQRAIGRRPAQPLHLAAVRRSDADEYRANRILFCAAVRPGIARDRDAEVCLRSQPRAFGHGQSDRLTYCRMPFN